MGFTAKELAGLVELTVVGLEAGFENEADLVAVAEIFGTAKAEAGAEFLGVFHGERVDAVVAGNVCIARNKGEAGVDDAVNLHVGSGAREGSKSAQRAGDCHG